MVNSLRKRHVLPSSTNGGNNISDDSKGRERLNLKREFGMVGGLSLVIGSMIGSGIFISPTPILAEVGSVGASLIVWGCCGLLATASALCYTELGLMMKKSGGEYTYIYEAYGEAVAFLLAWTNVIITKPSGLAIIALAFGQYALDPFYPGCTTPVVLQKLAAVFCIGLCTVINCFSVKLSNYVTVVFTFIKTAIVLAIAIGGFVMLGQGNTDNFSNAFEGTTSSISAFALSFYFGLWPYDGWYALAYISEEIENPERNLPLQILFGIPLVTILYILVNIAYFTVITPAELLSSSAVAITFGDRVFGAASFIIPVTVACSTFGAVNASVISTARLTYAAGCKGHLWSLMSHISVERVTPSPAVILNSLVSLIFLIPDSSTINSLINFFSFAAWIFYGFAFLAVIILRFKRPNWRRPYKIWIWVPAVCTLASVALVILPIIEDPSYGYLVAAVLIVAGLLFYYPLIYLKKTPPFMGPLTVFFQQLMEVVPPTDIEELTPDVLDQPQNPCC